ncbi:hypothetical protein CP061683_1260 [Chlamydia psittaci 06-1683]|nr:hypothetical protein CP061683_1260 [Chlamydia psittaci 06-1683]
MENIEIHIKHLFKLLRVLQYVGNVNKAVFSFINIDECGLNVS